MLLMAKLNPNLCFTHPYFTKEEHIQLPNTSIVRFEDGFEVTSEVFWDCWRIENLQNDWSIKEQDNDTSRTTT